MRQVQLPGTHITTSMLGFGTAAFGLRLDEHARRRLLETALDAGVTHLDTAPPYGDGTAEESVGRFLAGKRDRLTVTAKLGLLPPPGGSARRLLRSVGRRLPGISPAAAVRADGAAARSGLEATLRKLQTDHVDLLLLHECRPDDPALDDLQAVAEEAVSRGVARAVGIATDRSSSAALLARGGAFPAVVQAEGSLVDGLRDPAPGRATILHSVLASDLHRVVGYLAAAEDRRRSWTEASGVPAAAVAPLLLRAAADGNATGPVLFASRNPERIRVNATGAESADPAAVSALLELVAEVRAT
jgi:aryl-alcohol dehydrogenase-like predicted oxidoreductase